MNGRWPGAGVKSIPQVDTNAVTDALRMRSPLTRVADVTRLGAITVPFPEATTDATA